MDSGHFRFHIFDPGLIVLQIVAVQLLYYLSLAILLHLVCVGPDIPLSLGLLFDGAALKSWKVKTAYLLASPVAGGILGYVVGRAKQCLDFAATIHTLHFGITALASGIPRTASWWIVNASCIALTSTAAEYICMNINLGSIRLTGGKKKPRGSTKLRTSDLFSPR
mmetsp:Transcript_35256/g.92229  ORF Transcript_35256/g.92229 Transcript_35256/m.92229 type:complete len:166 (+) Transcript_35256:195-692(+)